MSQRARMIREKLQNVNESVKLSGIKQGHAVSQGKEVQVGADVCEHACAEKQNP